MPRKELEDWIFELGVEVHRLSTEIAPCAPKLARQKEWAPRADVIETPEHVLVKVELAGVRAGQLAIQFSSEKNCLTFRGNRADDTIDPRIPHAPHQLEIDYGQFAREIRLPAGEYDFSAVQGQLANGMLTLVIPKSAEKPSEPAETESTITVRRRR